MKYKAIRVADGREVIGYYVRHETRTPSACGSGLRDNEIEHMLFYDKASDWNMPRDLVYCLVDPKTLVPVDDNGHELSDDARALMDVAEEYRWNAEHIFHNSGEFALHQASLHLADVLERAAQIIDMDNKGEASKLRRKDRMISDEEGLPF